MLGTNGKNSRSILMYTGTCSLSVFTVTVTGHGDGTAPCRQCDIVNSKCPSYGSYKSTLELNDNNHALARDLPVYIKTEIKEETSELRNIIEVENKERKRQYDRE